MKNVNIALPYKLFERSGLSTSMGLKLVDETPKAIKVKDNCFREAWLPKSQIEIKEVV